MWVLAASRAESAAAALSLAILSSCFLLAVYRPRRTELEGTPHRVPNVALMIAVGWLVIMAGAAFQEPPASGTTELSLLQLWVECAVQLGVATIVGCAYLFSRGPDAILHGPDFVPENSPEEADEASPSPAPQPSRTGDWAHQAGVGITVGLASLLPTMLLGQLLAPDRDPGDTHVLLRTLQGKGWDYLALIILAAAVLAPVAEELLFRVVFQGWFADRVGKLAVLLTAGLFCLVHRPEDQLLLLPLALALGLLFEYRRSYLEIVAAHAAFNGANLFAAINAS